MEKELKGVRNRLYGKEGILDSDRGESALSVQSSMCAHEVKVAFTFIFVIWNIRR